MKKLAITMLATMGVMAASIAGVTAAEKFITIGTGGQTGVYYQVGGAICKLSVVI